MAAPRDRAPAAVLLLTLAWTSAWATDYFVHPGGGDDRNDGTNADKPWQSLQRAGAAQLQPGDRILLAAGQAFVGSLELTGAKGTPDRPVIVSTYPEQSDAGKAVIEASGWRSAVHLVNGSNVQVRGLELTADGPGPGEDRASDMRVGVLVELTQAGRYENIGIDDVLVRDLYFAPRGVARSAAETRTANGTQSYGFGIRLINRVPGATVDGLAITGVEITRVSHTGIKIGSEAGGVIRNVRIENSRITDSGGPGLQMSRVRDAVVRHNVVDGSGSTKDSRNWGRGSGMWTWRSDDVLIENNAFLNASGPGDSAGVHIDFGCRNVVIQYNLSANNAGGFCEILGEGSNNAYRYNVSVNDGHRVKGENGAFQEGKTFWLSGYAGQKAKSSGPFNTYFYNNTIFVDERIVSKFAVSGTADGVLIANNIFYIAGRSAAVAGDQFRPDRDGASRARNVVFRNNLYLRPDNWPDATGLRDSAPIIGDPGFESVDAARIAGFRPRNRQLVEDAGIPIEAIPGDRVGLPGGLAVSHDILGNPIVGRPDLGAIEVSGDGNGR